MMIGERLAKEYKEVDRLSKEKKKNRRALHGVLIVKKIRR